METATPPPSRAVPETLVAQSDATPVPAPAAATSTVEQAAPNASGPPESNNNTDTNSLNQQSSEQLDQLRQMLATVRPAGKFQRKTTGS
jgi:hypothetical protein